MAVDGKGGMKLINDKVRVACVAIFCRKLKALVLEVKQIFRHSQTFTEPRLNASGRKNMRTTRENRFKLDEIHQISVLHMSQKVNTFATEK